MEDTIDGWAQASRCSLQPFGDPPHDKRALPASLSLNDSGLSGALSSAEGLCQPAAHAISSRRSGTCMQHFVLTTLALGHPSTEWLSQRLVIFEHYCAASIQSQTARDFKWFLAITSRAPDWFIKRVVAAAPHAILVHQDGASYWANWPTLVRPFIRSCRLITTRLDNDDMIHKDFIAIVQNAARAGQHDFVIDFPVGYQLRLSDLQCRRVVRSKPTHFLSLVECGRRRQLAYCQQHQTMGMSFPILEITGSPIWVETCHSSNIHNWFSRYGRHFPWHTVKHLFV
jgi:hypothetical protein